MGMNVGHCNVLIAVGVEDGNYEHDLSNCG